MFLFCSGPTTPIVRLACINYNCVELCNYGISFELRQSTRNFSLLCFKSSKKATVSSIRERWPYTRMKINRRALYCATATAYFLFSLPSSQVQVYERVFAAFEIIMPVFYGFYRVLSILRFLFRVNKEANEIIHSLLIYEYSTTRSSRSSSSCMQCLTS